MRVAFVAVLASCSFSARPGNNGAPDGSTTHDARVIDAPVFDAPPDAFDNKCFGSGAFYVCLAATPTGSQSLPAAVNTTQCSGTGFEVAMMGTTPVCVFSGSSVAIGDTNVTGSRPLVIAATGDINETGYIDASSSNNNGDGPAANDASCATTNSGGTAATGGGGGAGGSFGTQGAAGGGGGGATGGVAGAIAVAPVSRLRGGCRGGNGGAGGGALASGGSGGGAVMLVARGTIHLSGTIDASGAGGNGGNNSKGAGGGGGAGGMIVLDGTVAATTSAVLFANGGGGGGGADQNNDGNAGSDATMYNVPAPGGPSVGSGTSAGGNGATQTQPPTTPTTSGTGGGGGGGGLGVIRLLGGASLQNAKYSPAPS